MVRVIGVLAGIGMVLVFLWALLWGAVSYISDPPTKSVEHRFHVEAEHVALSSDGPFGRFDRQQLQRGFQVYKEVCSACHSLHYVAFRDLTGIGFTEPEVKAIAKQWQTEVPSINPDTGEPATRKAEAADHFPPPFANEIAARQANNGANPPDLSLMAKSRHGGPSYIHALITGYRPVPADLPAANRPSATLHYNPVFANLNIAMPPPLTADGQVTYSDGTTATIGQMATDVSAFLVWTAEPKLENRHRTGFAVLLFLLIATGLAFMAYRSIWSGMKH